MNRRTLLTTLLSGLSAGVAAIAGRKNPELSEWQKGFPITSKNRVNAITDFTRSLSTRLVGCGNLNIKSSGILIPATDTESLFGNDPGKLITNAPNGFMVRNIDDNNIYIYRDGWIRCFPEGGLIDA